MDTKESVKRMKEGKLYYPTDENIMIEQLSYVKRMQEYNLTTPDQMQKRAEILKGLFGAIGEDCYIEPPYYANWGGKHVFFGNKVYANFHLTLVDDGNIYVGDNVMFGPNVTVATAAHPIEPHLRKAEYQYNLDVHIGNNVWIGAGAVILPGITIGENSVIGAGSVVTKDIPANVVAVGNPCRVLREIGEKDRLYYYKDRKIDIEIPDN